MIRSVVTGGSGFIGSHVVDALREVGHEVIVVDHSPPRHRKDVTFRAVDITDLDEVCAAFEGADYVHHLAAVADADQAFEQPVQCIEANILGTAHVLEAARRANVARVLFASSVSVYCGMLESHVDENTPLHMPGPGHVHSSSKIASELIVHDYAALYDLPITIFRYGVAYGPRMRDELMIPALLKRALSGQPLLIAGDGQQASNLVYVGDLARAHVLGLSEPCANQTFNLDGSRWVSVLAIAQAVRDMVGPHVTIEHVPGRPGEHVGKLASPRKAARVLGWADRTTFAHGMRNTFEWFRATHPIQAALSLAARPEAAS